MFVLLIKLLNMNINNRWLIITVIDKLVINLDTNWQPIQ